MFQIIIIISYCHYKKDNNFIFLYMCFNLEIKYILREIYKSIKMSKIGEFRQIVVTIVGKLKNVFIHIVIIYILLM